MIASRPDDHRNRDLAPQPPKRTAWRLALAVVLILIGIVGILAICFPAQFKQQLEVSVLRQPTPYTQLFFSDPAALPQKLEIDRVNKFSFTVVNNQGRSGTYGYTVTITDGKLHKVASQGTFTLGDSQSLTRTVGVEPTARGTQYLIRVTLSGTTDLIQFYSKTSK